MHWSPEAREWTDIFIPLNRDELHPLDCESFGAGLGIVDRQAASAVWLKIGC